VAKVKAKQMTKRILLVSVLLGFCVVVSSGCRQNGNEPEGEDLPYDCGVAEDALWSYEGEADAEEQPVLDVFSALEQAVFARVNEKRAEVGASALRIDPCAWQAARLHSDDLAANDYCSHTNLAGETFSERLDTQGIPWAECAEVICCKTSAANLPVHVVDKWMASPEHRESILSSDYSHAGVGAAQDSTGAWYFTEVLVGFD
jgi:uncharacterized protein YkwD